jgi:hypothetical protein
VDGSVKLSFAKKIAKNHFRQRFPWKQMPNVKDVMSIFMVLRNLGRWGNPRPSRHGGSVDSIGAFWLLNWRT